MDETWNELPFGSFGQIYEPLHEDHIRLVRLDDVECGTPDCTLATMPRDRVPNYIAISYTWGSPEDVSLNRPLGSQFYTGTRTILINGVPFQVRQNLYDLLEQVGKFEREIVQQPWLWIDALCINQADEDEKSAQVNRMGQIYEFSDWTLVWLGKAYKSTEGVVSMLKQVEKIGMESVGAAVDSMKGLYNSRVPDFGLEEPEEKQNWLEFMYFCRRSWFTRIWTVQEVVLSTTGRYLCGPFWIPWDTVDAVNNAIAFTKLGDWLTAKIGEMEFLEKDVVFPTRFHSLLRELVDGKVTASEDWDALCRRWYNVPGPSYSSAALLEYVLSCSSQLNCMDSRDRVFALLSIVKKASDHGKAKRLAIEANYRKCVAEVYTEAMAFILRETRCLTSLLHSRCPNPSHEGMPSWVPSFDTGRSIALLDLQAGGDLGDSVLYDASKNSYVGFEVRGIALTLHIHVFAIVTHVGESLEELIQTASIQKLAKLLLARVKLHPERRLWAEDLRKTMVCGLRGAVECTEEESRFAFRSFLTLLIGNQFIMAEKGELHPIYLMDQLSLLSALARLDPTRTIPDPSTMMEQFKLQGHELFDRMVREKRTFEHTVRHTHSHRRIFLLDNGDIGLGNESAEPGDALCVFADGGRCPAILRRRPSKSENSWQWIGEAYVDNIMYGEAVDQMEREGKTWQKATIT